MPDMLNPKLTASWEKGLDMVAKKEIEPQVFMTKLENYINAISIDGIGATNAKTISKHFDGDYKKFIDAVSNHYDFSVIDGFGQSINESIYNWYNTDYNNIAYGIENEFTFITDDEVIVDDSLKDVKFCITGTFSKSRDELKAELEKHGAKFVSSVSKNLDVLFVGENAGSKLEKAKEIGVRICREKELFDLLKLKMTEEQPEEKDETNAVELW